MGDESTIRGFQKSEMKLENVRRLTATCALPSTALVEKSTAARERYIEPRLGSQGSKLAVKQICMRSLGGFFACAIHELKRPTGNVKQRKRREREQQKRGGGVR
jgi:hypothetical protein